MNIPSYLYKYRSLRTKADKEHTSRILTHNEIYFAKCSEFNDPFDCRFHISVDGDFNTHKAILRQHNPNLSEEKIDIQTRKDLQPENIRKREQKLNNNIRRKNEKYGIFSMSAKCDNLLMWSHYADCHRGICIKFKTTGGKLFGCDLSKVDYQKQYPIFSVYDKPDFEFVKKYVRTKWLEWIYEEEWRIIYKETGCQSFLPEGEEISGVILGARISKRNKELVLKCLSQNNCKAKLYEAHEYKDRFGLDITLIKQ
jgi:Protein of unknown function (DUF2971)